MTEWRAPGDVVAVVWRRWWSVQWLVVLVVVGHVRVDVTGRVWVAVVTGWVVPGAVPVPATGVNVNAFKASSTLTG